MKYSFFSLIFWGENWILGILFEFFNIRSLRFFSSTVFPFFRFSRIIKNIFIDDFVLLTFASVTFWNFKKEASRMKKKLKNILEFVLLHCFWWMYSFVLLWFQSMVFYCFLFQNPFLEVLKKNSELKIRSFAQREWE